MPPGSPHCTLPVRRGRPHHPGEEGRPLSPYDDRPFGELAELFRRDAAPRTRTRTPTAGRPARPRPYSRGITWPVAAAAVVGLAAGIALAHGLLLASGLMLAGLSGHLTAGGRDRHR
ncbi:hypothetical protein [Streptomyces inhibens]|uniref:hypothetical protein n=1 Tax=Streptomyces inhibens TaxID=2293571 RepID=UPI001EE6C070|nr:hypothetical protein [Streptomyces inhibens]UKY48468.1 hypothetical protein KI385_06390 [Streptomyces inhibens]